MQAEERFAILLRVSKNAAYNYTSSYCHHLGLSLLHSDVGENPLAKEANNLFNLKAEEGFDTYYLTQDYQAKFFSVSSYVAYKKFDGKEASFYAHSQHVCDLLRAEGRLSNLMKTTNYKLWVLH